MRVFASSCLTLALLAGCGAKYKPSKAVVTGWDRTKTFATEQPSTVQYTGQALVAPPVVPMMAFGAAFDLDIVVRTNHPDWDMHEWARLSAGTEPMWLALESRSGTLEQVIVADVPDIDAFMPELPMQRKSTPFQVVDKSTNDELDVTLTYENAENQEVEVQFLGDPPYRWQKKRNGNTLGHSANTTLAVIDIPHRESLFKAKVKFDGQGSNVKRLGGLVPFQFAMEQVQGGLAVGNWSSSPSGAVRPLESAWPLPVVIDPNAQPAPAPEPEPEPENTTADALMAIMDANTEDLQGCYTTSAKANADLEGKVLLSWKVDAEGAPSDMTVVLNTTGDEALETCVSEKLAAWTYDASLEGDVGFPLVFVKGQGLNLHPEDEAKDDGADAAADDEALPDGEDLPEEPAAAEGEGEGEGLLFDDEPAPARAPAVVYNGLQDFKTWTTMPSGNQVEQAWKVDHQGNRVVVEQVSPVRTLRYEYLVHYDSLELADISVTQAGRAVPVMSMAISPAIPDLRKPFSGRQESRYVIDVNGQGGYATGTIEAWWSESGPKVKVMPDEPEWTATGDMVSSIVFRNGGAEVSVQKVSGE